MSRLAFSQGESKLFAAFGKAVYGFRLANDELRQFCEVPGFVDDIRIVVEGPPGLVVAAGGKGLHVVQLHVNGNGHTEVLHSDLEAHKDTIYALFYEPSTSLLLSSGKDKDLRIWRVQPGLSPPLQLLVSAPDAHDDWIMSAKYHPESGVVITASIDGIVKVWRRVNVRAGTCVTGAGDFRLEVVTTSTVGNLAEGTLAIHYNAEIRMALSASQNGTLQVWACMPGGVECLASTKGLEEENHSGWSRAVQFDPASGLIISGGDDGLLKVWQLRLKPRPLSGAAEDPLAKLSLKSTNLSDAWLDKTMSRQLSSFAGEATGQDYEEEDTLLFISQVQASTGAILALQFRPESKIVISAGDDGALRAYRLEATELTLLAEECGAHAGGAIVALQYDHAEGTVVSAGSDGMIKAWSLETAASAFELEAETSKGSSILDLQLDSNSGVVLSAEADGSISTWLIQLGTLTLLARNPGAHSGRIFAFQFDPDSGILLSAGADKAIRVWQLMDGTLHKIGSTTEELTAGVLALRYDARTGIVLSTGMDGVIRTWMLTEGHMKPLLLPMSLNSEGILRLEYDSTTGVLISAGIDGTVTAWLLNRSFVRPWGATTKGHDGWIRAMHVDWGTNYVASCGDDGAVRAYRLNGDTLVPYGTALDAHTDGARGVWVKGDLNLVFSGGDDGAIKAWRIQEWQVEPQNDIAEAHEGPITALCDDGKGKFFTGCMRGSIKAWRRQGEKLRQVSCIAEEAPHSGIMALGYHQASSVLISAGFDGAILTWSVSETAITFVAEHPGAHEGLIRALEIDAESGMFVSAGQDGSVRVWKLDDSRKPCRVAGRDAVHNEVLALQVQGGLSDDSMLVASSGDSGDIKVWRVQNEEITLAHSLDNAHGGGGVVALQLAIPEPLSAADGGYIVYNSLNYTNNAEGAAHLPPLLVSAGTDGTIRVWLLEGVKRRPAAKTTASKFTTQRTAMLQPPKAPEKVSLNASAVVRSAGIGRGGSGTVLSLRYEAARGVILASCADGFVRTWMVLKRGGNSGAADEQELQIGFLTQSEGHKGGALGLYYNSKDDAIVSVGRDRAIRLWKLLGGRVLAPVTDACDAFGKKRFVVKLRKH
eukprot:TRINITY_DN100622_c0_g1_i1.p1 TRINITY_DN100622_c0_g1~~TRINITY_DN100622_c0_g1_i1.p1  ORF type:complete len:1105 (-),score=229.53 TRINITY_DN100622_c0_g1_i1:75-3389(-)